MSTLETLQQRIVSCVHFGTRCLEVRSLLWWCVRASHWFIVRKINVVCGDICLAQYRALLRLLMNDNLGSEMQLIVNPGLFNFMSQLVCLSSNYS